MVYKLFVAKLAKSLKIYSVTERLPLEVEEVRCVCLLPRCIVSTGWQVDFLLWINDWVVGADDFADIDFVSSCVRS